MPVIFPVQKCQDCGKYYFIEPEQYHPVDIDAHVDILNFAELKEAFAELHNPNHSDWGREMLCLELIKAYNDEFNRSIEVERLPSGEDISLFQEAVNFLLSNSEDISPLLHAELLRESGRFEEAEAILRVLANNEANKSQLWSIKPVLDGAINHNPLPILLWKDGKPLAIDQ